MLTIAVLLIPFFLVEVRMNSAPSFLSRFLDLKLRGKNMYSHTKFHNTAVQASTLQYRP
jgi:hypothetical protein